MTISMSYLVPEANQLQELFVVPQMDSTEMGSGQKGKLPAFCFLKLC